MTKNQERKGGGGKLTRSQVVTVRLDPKLRYLAELAARKQRRTVSSFIEWAIEESLSNVPLMASGAMSKNETSVAQMAETLWDIDEPDRFVKLAFNCPELLNHEDQMLWKLVQEQDFLWKGKTINDEKTWKINEASFYFRDFRMCWEDFKRVVSGELQEENLGRIHADKIQEIVRKDLDSNAKYRDKLRSKRGDRKQWLYHLRN